MKKLSKEEFDNLCQLLISDSEEDFQLGKRMAYSMNIRFGRRRRANLSDISDYIFYTCKTRGLYREKCGEFEY